MPVAALDFEHDVGAEPLVHERCAGFDGFAQIADRRENFILDRDGLGCCFGGEAVFGHDRRDDVADVAHLVGGKGRAWRAVHRPPVAERHRVHDRQFAMTGAHPIRGRQRQQDTGKLPGGINGDAANVGMRVRAAHERAPGRAWQRHVVDKAAVAADEMHIFAAAQRLPDKRFTRDRAFVHQPKMAARPRASSLRQK